MTTHLRNNAKVAHPAIPAPHPRHARAYAVIPAKAGASADGTSIQRGWAGLPPLAGEMSEGQRGPARQTPKNHIRNQ